MTSHRHAAVWMDQHEAKIFHVDRESFDEQKLQAPTHHVHRHGKGAGEPHEHPDDATHYYKEVAKALADVDEVLVVGPSTAKLHFIRSLHAHDKALEAKVVGLETVDHPTDPQLVAYVKHYFRVPAPRVH